jgi:hypothetical protein
MSRGRGARAGENQNPRKEGKEGKEGKHHLEVLDEGSFSRLSDEEGK